MSAVVQLYTKCTQHKLITPRVIAAKGILKLPLIVPNYDNLRLPQQPLTLLVAVMVVAGALPILPLGRQAITTLCLPIEPRAYMLWSLGGLGGPACGTFSMAVTGWIRAHKLTAYRSGKQTRRVMCNGLSYCFALYLVLPRCRHATAHSEPPTVQSSR
jgi:hypothetical protein